MNFEDTAIDGSVATLISAEETQSSGTIQEAEVAESRDVISEAPLMHDESRYLKEYNFIIPCLPQCLFATRK